MPCAIPPTGPGRSRARVSRDRAISMLAGLAFVLVTAVGCSGSDSGSGFAPPGGGVGTRLEQDFVRVVNQSLPSIAEITSENGIGSGVVFDDKGNIVTNAHVVGRSTNFQVRLSTGTQTFPATLVGSFPPDDLAVIRVQGAPALKPAKFGRSSALEVGDIVMAMGNPFGLDATVTNGIVSALGRTVEEPPTQTSPGTVLRQAIQTSAPINPGNSGGALVNLNSEVIGIPTLVAVNPESGGSAPGIGFAIPSDIATDLARQIIDNGRVVNSRRAALGVSVTTVTDQSGTPVAVGISSVIPGGPAATAGLQNGDVITKIDDVRVTTAQQLQEVVATKKPGETVRITFIRLSGEANTVPVMLGELPSLPSS